MKMAIVGIFDRKAQTFISLEPTPHQAVAIRQMTEAINKNTESPLFKWPGDFSLWHMGNWDSNTGELEPLEKSLIIEAENLKQI